MDKKNFFLKVFRGNSRNAKGIDLTKRWYVEYKCKDRDGKAQRRIFYVSSRLKTAPEREREIARILRDFGALEPGQVIQAKVHPLVQALKTRSPYLGHKGRLTYESKVRRFLEWIGHKDPAMVTYLDACNFVSWLQEKGVNNTTINNYIVTLKSIFKVLVKTGKLRKNPFDGVSRLKENRRSLLRFRENEVKLLKDEISNTDPQLYMAIQFVYYCFIRPSSELLKLKIGDIDFNEGIIIIPGSISKNRKLQHVTIPRPFLAWLLKNEIHHYRPDYYVIGKKGIPGPDGLSVNNLTNRHRIILNRMGFKNRFGVYSWKHTGVWFAVKAGINLKELQLQLRHHSLDMVNEYLKNLGLVDMPNISDKFPPL